MAKFIIPDQNSDTQFRILDTHLPILSHSDTLLESSGSIIKNLGNSETQLKKLGNSDAILENSMSQLEKMGNADTILGNSETQMKKMGNSDTSLENSETQMKKMVNSDTSLENSMSQMRNTETNLENYEGQLSYQVLINNNVESKGSPRVKFCEKEGKENTEELDFCNRMVSKSIEKEETKKNNVDPNDVESGLKKKRNEVGSFWVQVLGRAWTWRNREDEVSSEERGNKIVVEVGTIENDIKKSANSLVNSANVKQSDRSVVKPSNKRPPRPPRPPRSGKAGEWDPARELLMLGITDIALIKKARKERLRVLKKKQAAKNSSPGASMWALLFTVCFCVIMLLQGVFSRGNVNAQFTPIAAVESRKILIERYDQLPNGETWKTFTKTGSSSLSNSEKENQKKHSHPS